MVTKIDIYVKSSFLNRGKQNPSEAGGWGAVVVIETRSGTKTRFLGGAAQADLSSNHDVQRLGILSALRDVRDNELKLWERPVINLHTDQLLEVLHISAVAKGRRPATTGLKRYLTEIEDIALEMKIQFVFEKNPNADAHGVPKGFSSYMSIADQLAKVMAWRSRLEKQGYVHRADCGVLKGEEALKNIGELPPPSVDFKIIEPEEPRGQHFR